MGEDGNNEKGSESTPKSDHNTTGNDIDEDGEAPEASKEDVQNQSEQSKAANPEPDPQGPETNESAINESAATEEPTSDDVAISGTELTTETNAATVTGTATNEADEPLTLDLEVQFLQEGEQLGRPALGGTTGLAPGDEWDFSITARGSGAGEATDYEIATYVRTQG
ncbi:FxLYD domain-containing protein [Halalkalicoccus jeotgali]|nr:FxLYD domain-containing protein [Halalkalicoccus jeotgali]ADJ16810.1 hypothetical protein HacjB3_17338 [Halalkalicoccus jeotgali B3]ADJ17204.1 hypothetical protein HacjB3_19338 [Halalkalicoccus jeotgali B3]